jgi:ribose transport system ATP-binding protein
MHNTALGGGTHPETPQRGESPALPATEGDSPVSLLRVEGLTKEFPGTLALDRIDFEVARGEIHALVGENGAGKSTLIKILAGVYQADEGHIWLDGQPYTPGSGSQIAFIHQDLGLFAAMTVAENIAVVAGYPRSRGLIAWGSARVRAREILGSMGSDIDVDDPVAALTSAERSIVAIARALALDSELLVLDEPTASLPETDVRRLFDILNGLKQRGIGIVFVSHRLDEVFRLADRVTVLRDGRTIATQKVSDTTPGQLVFDIVGRKLEEMFISPKPPEAEVVLDLRDVKVGPVGPVSLQLHRGEILGLVGLRGAGQDLIGRAVFGEIGNWRRSGDIWIDGSEARLTGAASAMRLGVAFVSSRRAEEGIAGSLTVRENIYPNPVTRGQSPLTFQRPSDERRRVRLALDRFDVRPRNSERAVGTLSGGNQQKTVLARWLEADSRILILEEPTFGVDVGAKAEIYAILEQDLIRGSSVLLVSSDFEEVAGIAHRALVFRRGRVIAEVPKEQLSVSRLTHLASGASSEHDSRETA